ncbi:hypothetical protein PIROE2DRAFT_2869 [Piromyces sp. E2]|nr:hypothetical protein PIROE2DRAFT_2869 [Piromyces sp. E2]|eukprot:OUM69175.1 hypothetical protein PIROE2DRAFT_2869 [Piromyces sp. E2]
MSNYRNNIRNLYREARFSIPFNNTTIKRRMLINKLGLSQEIESALACSSTNRNSKINNKHNNLTIPPKVITLSKFKNSVSPHSYDKTYSSDVDDSATVCNESSISLGNRVCLRSPTPDQGEELPSFALSPILRKGNIVLMRNESDIDENDNEIEDITLCISGDNNENIYDEHSFIIRKPNIGLVRKAKSLYIDPVVDDFYLNTNNDYKIIREEELHEIESNHSHNEKINEELTDVETVVNDGQIEHLTNDIDKEKNIIKESRPLQSDNHDTSNDEDILLEEDRIKNNALSPNTNINTIQIPSQFMEPEEEEEEEEEKEIAVHEVEKPISVNNDAETDVPYVTEDQQLEAEQMILQFVAFDEQEKTRLQQAIIDQTTQRLNEKQQEADRLTNKINQQKAKMEEHKARHRHLSQELELKRRQSAELRLKLTTQFEKNQQQRKELNYYKEMNSKYMEVNRQLQEQIRELTKLKYLKL